MSSGEGTEASISREIDRVKNLIEQCLMDYMNKEEVIHVLYQQQNIEPAFTKIVWQNLEEQNPEFFKQYYLRIILKEQITRFNNLLEIHVVMVNQQNTNKVTLSPLLEGSNIQPPMQPVPSDLPSSGIDNYGQSIYSEIKHASDPSLLAQNPNVGTLLGINNGNLIDEEWGCLPDFSFDDDFDSSFNYMNLNQHQLNRSLSDDVIAYLQYLQNQGENTRQPNQSTNMDFKNFGRDS